MSTFDDELLIALTMDANGFLNSMDKAQTAVAAFVDIAAKAAQATINWDTELTQIANNAGLTNQQMQQMGTVIKGAALESTASLTDLGDAAMHAANFGFKDATSEAQILDAALKSATSTGASTSSVAQLLSATLHEYGLSADHAAQVTDLIHLAAQKADTTFGSFAESAARALGVAANLHIPIEQVVSAISALTQHGYSADESVTQIVAAITHLEKPSAQAADEFDNLAAKTGETEIASKNLLNTLSTQGLSGILDGLHAAFSKLGLSESDATAETMKLLNAQRGGLGVATLLGQGAQDYTNNLQAMAGVLNGTATPTQDAYNRSTQTLGYQLGELGNQVQLLAIDVGQYLTPAVSLGKDVIGDFVANLEGRAQPSLNGATDAASRAGISLRDFAVSAGIAGGAGLLAFGPMGAAIGVLGASVIWLGDQWAGVFPHIEGIADSTMTPIVAKIDETNKALKDLQQTADHQPVVVKMQFDAPSPEQIAAQAAGVDDFTKSVSGLVDATVSQVPLITAAWQDEVASFDAVNLQQAAGYKAQAEAATALADSTSNATQKLATALKQMAADTAGGTASAAKGLTDVRTLLANLPKDLSPAEQALVSDMSATWDNVARAGGVGAEQLHNLVVGWIQRLKVDGDFETANAMQAILDEMAAAQAPAAQIGSNTGSDYVHSLVAGASGGMPGVTAWLNLLLDEMGNDGKLSTITAMLGAKAGREFSVNLAAQEAVGMTASIDNLRALASTMPAEVARQMFGDVAAETAGLQAQIDKDNKIVSSGLSDLGLILNGAGKMVDIYDPAPKPKKPPKGPADPGKQMAQTLESIVKALQQADQDSQGPSASIAKAVEDILVVAREKVPADAKWIQDALDGLIAKYQAGQLTTEQYHTAVNDMLKKIAAGHGDLAIAAQASLDLVAQADQKAATSADNKADRITAAALRENLSVINSAATMAENATKSNTTIGDSQVALLGVLETAQKDHLGPMTDWALGEWNRMQTGAGVSNKQLHDDTIAFLQDQADKSTGIIHAQYVAQLAEIRDGDAQIAAQQHQHQDALAGGFGGIFGDLNAAKQDLPKTISDILALAGQAQEAGMTAQAASLRQAAQEMWSGDEDQYRDGAKRIAQVYSDLGQNADLQTQATMAKVNADTKAGLDAQTAAFQKAQQDIATALGSLGTELAGGTAAPPKLLLDTYSLIDKLKANNLGDWAAKLTADAQHMHDGVAGAQEQTAADVLAAEQQLRASTDPVVSAEADFQIAEAQRTHDGVVKAQEQTNLEIEKSVGALDLLLRGNANVSAPEALVATYDLIQKLNTAGQGDWAKRLQADADAVKAGVPGALAVMDADALSYLVQLANSSDPVMAAWARDLIDKATAAGQGVSAGLAQGIAQGQQSLATGLGALGQAILSGKDSPIQALIALAPLAKAASDAGLKPLADQITAMIARGGSLAEVLALINKAEQQLIASGDPLAALMAQQAEAAQAQAAAVVAQTAVIAQYQEQVKALQEVEKQDAALVQQQTQYVQELTQAYDAQKTKLQEYQQMQLAGTEAQTAAESRNKAGSSLAGLAMDDLTASGGNGAAAAANLKKQYAEILAQHQAAEADLQKQIGLATDPATKKALQDQLEQLLTLDQSQGGIMQKIQAALAASDPQKALQALVAQLQNSGAILSATGGLATDPLKSVLAGLQNPANEGGFGDIVAGETKAKDAMALLTPQIDGAKKKLAELQEVQQADTAAVAAMNAQLADQQAKLQAIQQGTVPATQAYQQMTQAIQTATTQGLAPLSGQFQTAMDAVAAVITQAGDTHTDGAVAGAWMGPKGLLPAMLSKLGGAGSITGGAPGNGGSFVPNVYASFKDVVDNLIPDALQGGMPGIVTYWGGQINDLKALAADPTGWKAAGDSIDQGVAAGITESTHFIEEAARTAVDRAIEAAKVDADSHSPSRRAADEIGAPLGQGVVVGILSQKDAIAAALAATVSDAITTADPAGMLNGFGTGPQTASQIGDIAHAIEERNRQAHGGRHGHPNLPPQPPIWGGDPPHVPYQPPLWGGQPPQSSAPPWWSMVARLPAGSAGDGGVHFHGNITIQANSQAGGEAAAAAFATRMDDLARTNQAVGFRQRLRLGQQLL